MTRWLLPLSLAVALLACPISAMAYYCTEPTQPYCLDSYGTFEDEYSFDRCRREVQDYVEEVKTYAECLDRNKRAKAQEASQAIDRFNCKAKGGRFCP